MNFRIIIFRIFFLYIILGLFTVNYLFAQNLVKNPGYETGLLSPSWDVWPKNIDPVVVIDTVNVFSGNFSAKLGNVQVYLYQPVNLEPNTTYTVSAAIRSFSGDSILFGVGNVYSSGGSTRYFSNTNYETQTWSFTTDESPGNDPNIYIWKEVGTGIAWVDNIVLMKEIQGNQPNPPGGFSTFYVSPDGNDSNSGTSQESAWQTINKVNNIDFEPGNQILFEGGSTFNGTIVFDSYDHGITGNEVFIGSFGTGRATINAQNGSGLIVYDCNNIHVKNLNFIGSGRDNNNNTGNGITFSYCSDIIIDSVEISEFQHSGLKINNMGENFTIKNIHSYNNGYAGIYVSGITKSSFSDIYIGYCSANNNPGDPTVLDNHSGNGIFIYNASNVIIEYCEAFNNGWDMPWNGNGPGGIWVAETDNALIQHCISHGNKTSSAQDGLGFDLDGGTTNSTIQYCLSYNNAGAGYGIFQYSGASDWRNNTIRYCVSENDGNDTATGSVYFWNGADNDTYFQGFEFYNNVVYNANGPALSFLNHINSGFNFRNNIFVSQSNSVHNGINGENFQGNCWYSLNGQFRIGNVDYDFEQWATITHQEMLDGEVVGMYANPMLINPGNSMLSNPAQMSYVDDYKVNEVSPVINSALNLNSIFNINPGPQDYFGTSIKQGSAFDIGIYEYFDTTRYVQEVSLSPGWNIMSFRLIPNDTDMLNILQPLIDEGKLKKVIDESGNFIEDWGNFGSWKNTIGGLKNTEGYKVNVVSASTLQVEGLAVQLSYDIPLHEGWNIIAWPASYEQDGLEVFQELINGGKLKKVMDEKGNVIEDWGSFGDWKNYIGNLKPGEGYKVNVTDDCTLTIHQNLAKSVDLTFSNVTSTHFIPAYTGNGNDHMNINLVNLADSGILKGDEIGVFDGDICVGSAKIDNLNTFENLTSTSIPVSAEDRIEEKNGFKEGNIITLKLFRDGNEYPLKFQPCYAGNSVFRKGSSLFAEVYVTAPLERISDSNKPKIISFPNPFKDEVTIEINLAEDMEVQIEVINQLGQQVKKIVSKQKMHKGQHILQWDGKNTHKQSVAPGIYFLRFITDDSLIQQTLKSLK